METASFLGSGGSRAPEDKAACQKQEVSLQFDTCMVLGAAAEDDDEEDGDDTLRKFSDQPVGRTSVECLMPEGNSGTLACPSIATQATGVQIAGATTARDTCATIVSETADDTEADIVSYFYLFSIFASANRASWVI